MCVSCLLLSTLMMFTPAQAVDQTPGSIPIATYNQQSSSPVAQETQAAIAGLLNKLPKSSEFNPLREELNALYTQLGEATDDTHADRLIDDGVQIISDRVMAEPNAGQVREILLELREAEYEKQSPNLSSLKLLQKTTNTIAGVHLTGGSWGWLS